jgi:alkylation response protein AidB-like acyl-CoA dehydrogenase
VSKSPTDELLRFLEETLPAGWADAAEAGDDGALRSLRRGLDVRAVIARLGAAGWVAPHWPVEHGGRGLDEAQARAVYELLDRWNVPRIPRGSGFVLAAPAIRAFSEEATKRRFLPLIVTGEEQWAQLFSEPGAGSDLASLATRAVRDGDEWVVNGQKVWTTLAQESQFAMLLARTDPDVPKHDGITYFGVDLRAPGVDVRPLHQITGETEFNEVFLTDVRIPDLHRISPVGEGWAASHTTLSAERLTLSGTSARQRQSRGILGGKTIDEVLEMAHSSTIEPSNRDRLAQAYIETKVLALTVERSAVAGSSGSAAAVTKIGKATVNQDLQVLAVHLLGAPATAWPADDADIARYNREFLRTRANSIEGGTSEIQRNVIGERVLGLPREPDAYKGRPWSEVPRS